MRREAVDMLVMAGWWCYTGIGRHSPVVVTTHKRQTAAQRAAFELGRDTERYFPRPSEGPPRRGKGHLALV